MMEYTRKIPIVEMNVKRTAKIAKKSKKVVKRKTTKRNNSKKIVKRKTVNSKNQLKIVADDRTRWKKFEPELRKLLPQPVDVLKNVKYKARAIKLLDSLNGNVTWDSNGTVSVQGKELPYTHIGELTDAYFNNSKARPNGWETFKRILPDYEESKDASTQWENTAAKKKKNVGIQWEPWPGKQTPSAKRSPVQRLTRQGAAKNIL